MDDEPLERLFARFRDHGDAAAFARLFDRAAPALLAVARRIARRRSDADDLVQATFLTAIERAAEFDCSRSLMAWLVGILARHARNAARKTAHDCGRTAPELADDPKLLDSLIELERRSAVAVAIRELPEPYRQAIFARWTGTAEGGDPRSSMLRMRLHRGISRLRRLLPRALFGAALAALLDRKAIAAIRPSVLHRAGAAGLAHAPVPATAVLLGGTLVWKKLVAVGVLVAGVLLVIERTKTNAPTPIPESASASAASAPVVATPSDSAVRVASETGQPAANAETTATARVGVSGRVLDDATGAPIARAACFLGDATGWDGAFPEDTARTDEAGTFVVPISFHRTLIIAADGFALSKRPLDDASDSSPQDVGDLRLVRGASVRGHVFDAAGAPVAGAELFLLDSGGSSPTFYPDLARPVGSSRSDGSFEVEHVPPSGGFEWRLFALSPLGVGAAGFAAPGGTGRSVPVDVKLFAVAAAEVDVVDAGGAAVGGAIVDFVPIRDPFVLSDWSHPVHLAQKPPPGRVLRWAPDVRRRETGFRATTDATGRAIFARLPAGLAHTVIVAAPGFQTWFQDVVRPGADSSTQIHASLARDRFVAIGGRVVDSAGGILSDTVVERYDSYQCEKSKLQDSARTDREGRFRFEGITAGTRVELCVGKSGFARRPLTVQAPAQADIDDVELIATAAAPISGTVVDTAGAPIRGASVLVHRGEEWVLCDRAETDADGRFRISNAISGRWEIQVGLPGGGDAWVERYVEFAVQGGDECVRVVGERSLEGYVDVRVAIIDADTREPLEPSKAYVRRRRVVSGANDELSPNLANAPERGAGFVRLPRWRPGTWRAEVECVDRPKAWLDFELASSDTTVRLELAVPHFARVGGRVVAADPADATDLAAALASGSVHGTAVDGLTSEQIEPRAVSLSGAADFEFQRVPPRPLEFHFVGGPFVGHARLDASSNGDHVIEIAAVRAGRLAILGSDRYPAGALWLRFEDGSAHVVWIPLSDDDRTPRVEVPIAPGSWRWQLRLVEKGTPSVLSIMMAQPAMAEGTLEVRAGVTTELAIRPNG